ncbi:PREDICTED: probable inactive 1-aminocyclopropane-1-carboxylate synthase-like protein 2, partial [Chinchilla lanigera]|uniref:probable inactive 1-aminocyclopropane-1-carboxylate synthase-like protein 2 n=1 Tax=Chinchilla lanigera TaxID=34839 RepID=UPI000698409A
AQGSDSQVTRIRQTLSNCGSDIYTFYHSQCENYEAYLSNNYSICLSSLCFRNLGLIENRLSIDLLSERFRGMGMNYCNEVLLQYPNSIGHRCLREAVAHFLCYYSRAPFSLKSKHVVVLNGCSAVFSALAMVLCDPGDSFLVPTPFYEGFIFASKMYANIELIPVHVESETTDMDIQPFQLTLAKVEQALLEAKSENKRVKGLLLNNPQKLVGHVYSKELLKEYLEFAKSNKMHVVIDETYMLPMSDDSVTFHSVLSLESFPDPQRTHVIWNTRRDFGLRFGALYTQNEDVVFALTSFGYLYGISGTTQHHLSRLLQDRGTDCTLGQHRGHRDFFDVKLHQLENRHNFKIISHNRGSGLYIWINLKNLLEPCTFREELILYRRFRAHKLILCSGKSYLLKEPGWFRLSFAQRPSDLKDAMHRFGRVIAEQKWYWMEKIQEDVPGRE